MVTESDLTGRLCAVSAGEFLQVQSRRFNIFYLAVAAG
jgi:hypothetical protein